MSQRRKSSITSPTDTDQPSLRNNNMTSSSPRVLPGPLSSSGLPSLETEIVPPTPRNQKAVVVDLTQDDDDVELVESSSGTSRQTSRLITDTSKKRPSASASNSQENDDDDIQIVSIRNNPSESPAVQFVSKRPRHENSFIGSSIAHSIHTSLPSSSVTHISSHPGHGLLSGMFHISVVSPGLGGNSGGRSNWHSSTHANHSDRSSGDNSPPTPIIDLSKPRNRMDALKPSQAALAAAAKLKEEEEKNSAPAASLKCAICLSLAAEDTPLSATLCGHIFCQECLDAALSRVRKCPICRKPVGKKGVHRLYL